MIKQVRIVDNAEAMSFLVQNEELLEKCNKIWDKVSNIMKKGFGSEPVYGNKYFKVKTKCYNNKMNIIFHDSNVPTDRSLCLCLSKIAIHLVFKMGIKYAHMYFEKDANAK